MSIETRGLRFISGAFYFIPNYRYKAVYGTVPTNIIRNNEVDTVTQIFLIFLPPFTGQEFEGFPLVGVQRTTAGFTLMTGVQRLHITGFRRGKELAGFIKVRKVDSQTSFSNETPGWYRIVVL